LFNFLLDFYIESRDSLGNLAVSEIFSYEVMEPPINLDIIIIVTVGSTGVTLGSIGAYRAFYRGKSLSSKKIKEKVEQKNKKEEGKEEEENKKRKSDSKKGKPYLKIKINLPPTVIAVRSYKAEVKIVNKGLATAKNIKIKIEATPNLKLDNEILDIDELKCGKEKIYFFTYKASEQLEKGIYKICLTLTSENTKVRTYTRHLRGQKIGVLLGSDKPHQMNSLREWFKEHEYMWNKLSKADDYLKLRRYDLLILPPEIELEKKEVNIISKFVGNGQSLLLIDKIATEAQKEFMEILGYNEIDFEHFKSSNGVLRIANNQHSITNGFSLEEEILIGSYWGNASISDNSGELIAVQNITNKNGKPIIIPAIVANKYGNGKSLHLNFHAEETISQINDLLENALNWLLNEHSSEKVLEA